MYGSFLLHPLWVPVVVSIGLLVSLATLLLGIISYVQNRVALKVSLEPIAEPHRGFLINVRNNGGKPVHTWRIGVILSTGERLSGVYYKDEERGEMSFCDTQKATMARLILVNECVNFYVDPYDEVNDYKESIDYNKAVAFVQDETGRYHWSHDPLSIYLKSGRFN